MTDYFRGLGQRPVIFDTDTHEPKLASFFPGKAKVIDLDKVPGQMALFDRLSLPSAETRVVDLTHRHFEKFFELMRAMDFATEARTHDVVPAILYIAGRDPETYERGLRLMREFPEYAFVLVENLFLGEVEVTTRVGEAYQTFQDHEPHMVMPPLEPFFAGMIDNTTLSLAEFTRERPASVATRRFNDSAKSSSPRMAASVISATAACAPTRSASISMTSPWISVESTSKTMSRLARRARL